MQKSNGGYKIIDLKSKTIYNDIKSNYGKALLFTNIEIDNVEKNDVFGSVISEYEEFVFSAYGKKFRITQENNIVISDNELYLNLVTIYASSSTSLNLTILSNKKINSLEDLEVGVNYPASGIVNNLTPLFSYVTIDMGNKVLKTYAVDKNEYTNSFSLFDTFINSYKIIY